MRLTDFVDRSTLGLRVIRKKREETHLVLSTSRLYLPDPENPVQNLNEIFPEIARLVPAGERARERTIVCGGERARLRDKEAGRGAVIVWKPNFHLKLPASYPQAGEISWGRGTSLIRNNPSRGPYSSHMPRDPQWS